MAKRQATSKVVRASRGGQITIPAEFRRQLGIGEHSLLQLTLEQGELRITPVAPGQEDSAPLSEEEELGKAIKQAVAAGHGRGALALVGAWSDVSDNEIDAFVADVYAGRARDHGRQVNLEP